jgi:diguanylate cyclase (GGDEF)-like protein/PAS domain S-box-containing protein
MVVAENRLVENERLYRSVLEASADCIKILTPDGRLEFMNGPGMRLMELPDLSRIKGKLWSELWPEEMQDSASDAVSKARTGETVRFSGPCATAGGELKWWDVVVTPIRSDAGAVTGILSISRDCTAEREKAEEHKWASEHDSLTTLPNRRAFQKRLRAAAVRAMRHGTKLGLLLVDLDHFKHVNDTLGHASGDALLEEFGRRLRSTMRAADFVARIGGDEFAIIVEQAASSEDLQAIGEKAAAALSCPVRIHDRVLSGGASIGGAVFPGDADSANELFKVADMALYALKAEGRGGVKLFHSYMREEAQRVASQLGLARTAINEHTVHPHYQPKFDLVMDTVVGFEALLRWEHPTMGLQLPHSIEEAFKDYELASKVGRLMQDKVFADMSAWQRSGVEFGRISINAAPAEFLRDDYAERLIQRLEKHGVPPSCVEIEVTEHVFMASASRYVRRALAELKSAGLTIALDDFGTGYSSLSHLRDFPVDVVKIDQSFVQRMLVDPEIGAIVSAVVGLANSLRIVAVAEGVETKEQADMLRVIGCTHAQGYLLGAAQPAEVIARGQLSNAAA